METLYSQVENLIDNSQYNDAVNLVAEKFNIKLKVVSSYYGSMKWDKDETQRYIFKLQLSKGGRRYTFGFGQSIAQGNNEPTLYDVLACLQKYDVGSFEDFCGDFGYNTDSRTAKKTYKAVVKEYDKMCSLFSNDEIEILQLIS